MILIRPDKIILLSVLIAVSSACGSVEIKDRFVVTEKRSLQQNREYEIFDTSSVTGTGLKLERDSFQPRKCIKNSESSTTGGSLNFEFIDPSSDFSGEKEAYRDFIHSAITRASAYNISGMEPVSLVCIVSVSGRLNYLIDNSIQLTETAEGLLRKNNIDGFYKLCGTMFVDSTLFESELAFVVTYYMPADEADSFKGRIKYGKENNTSDIINFSIFREAGNRYPVFFSVSGSSDSLFIPLEFPIASSYGSGSEDFIKNVIQSCLSSDSGRISSLQIKKWIELPDINRYMPQRKGVEFNEHAHDSIENLEHDMHDFSVFRINMNRYKTEKNEQILDNLSKKINWKKFYKCSWGISLNGYISPDQEKDCNELLDGIKNFRNIEIYNPSILELIKSSSTGHDSFRDLRLIDKTILPEDKDDSESEYRFDDRKLYVEIPEKVLPGQTIDVSGKLYSSNCIKPDSIVFISNKNNGISSIRTDCYPVEFKKWGLMKRLFFFWKKPPPQQPYYRGNLEVTGFSEELSNDFKITEEASQLAGRDLMKFYEKFGTHYISQVKGRRGLVYYFSIDSEKDIRVEPYGLSSASPDQTDTVIPAEMNDGCLFSFIGKLMNQEKVEPLLHPATVKDFFINKNDLVKIVREGSESVPVELYLKPWSQYLVERGIIRIDQTIPVTLYNGKEENPAEGVTSFTDIDGDKYDGMMSNGLKNGYGTLKTRRGSEYKGDWMGDLMHGKGTYRHKDGSVYTGDFKYGYPHGTGENRGTSGNIYKGSIFKGMFTGQGEMLYRDGRKYRGEFKNGEPDGHGVMEFPDGKRIDGNFRKGVYPDK